MQAPCLAIPDDELLEAVDEAYGSGRGAAEEAAPEGWDAADA